MFTLGGDGGADREQARVEVGAVAEVLEDVRRVGEGRGADPVGALATHLRHGQRAPLRQPHRHAVTADAALREAALGHHRRAVVRAARAEGRQPHQTRARRGGAAAAPAARAGAAPAPARSARASARSTATTCARRELALGGHQRRAGEIALAEQARALRARRRAGARAAPRSAAASPRRPAAPRVRARSARALGLERPHQRHLVDREARAPSASASSMPSSSSAWRTSR